VDFGFVIGTKDIPEINIERLKAENQQFGDLILLEEIDNNYGIEMNVKIIYWLQHIRKEIIPKLYPYSPFFLLFF